MDRDEAINLLTGGREGIAEWNRRRNPRYAFLDLSGANLSAANLIGADLTVTNLDRADLYRAKLKSAILNRTNLRGANLSDTDLTEANLTGARLNGADLTGANFHRANLFRANLHGANLRDTDLTEADLTEADLTEAILTGADLSGANLTGTKVRRVNLSGTACRGTTFANLDLSEVRGLDSVMHYAPSTVGVDTLFRSKGKISEMFLHGCGVPHTLLEYLPSILGSMQPIQFYSCFISHSSKDQPFADRLHARMVQEKLSVWYAPEDMRGGRKSVEQIDQAIRVHDKVLLVLSQASMASDWVRYEIKRAVKREKEEKRQILFPIGLVSQKTITAWSVFDSDLGKDLAEVVREYHIPQFSKWKAHDSFEDAFARLLEDLKAVQSAGPDALAPRASRRKKPR